MNIKKKNRKSNRRYVVNDDYFKKWSHNMAYILGFWWADGHICVGENHCIFVISQHNKDKYILAQFLKEMESNAKIYKHSKRDACSIQITSNEIVGDIMRLGGKERKV